MALTFKAIEREDFNVKSYVDHRKHVNKLIVSYTGNDGYEYKKSYEFPVSTSMGVMIKSFPKQIE